MKIRGLCRHKYSRTAEELSGFSTINAFGFTMDSALLPVYLGWFGLRPFSLASLSFFCYGFSTTSKYKASLRCHSPKLLSIWMGS